MASEIKGYLHSESYLSLPLTSILHRHPLSTRHKARRESHVTHRETGPWCEAGRISKVRRKTTRKVNEVLTTMLASPVGVRRSNAHLFSSLARVIAAFTKLFYITYQSFTELRCKTCSSSVVRSPISFDGPFNTHEPY